MKLEDPKNRRVDEKGRAFKGSQLQVQIYVARRQEELSVSVKQAFAKIGVQPVNIEWVAPLESDAFKEPFDKAFLKALRLQGHEEELQKFLPNGGPNWDALGIVQLDNDENGFLLVEGKNYPGKCTV